MKWRKLARLSLLPSGWKQGRTPHESYSDSDHASVAWRPPVMKRKPSARRRCSSRKLMTNYCWLLVGSIDETHRAALHAATNSPRQQVTEWRRTTVACGD